MTMIACPRLDSIFTTLRGRDECVEEQAYSIDTASKPQPFWRLTQVQAITAVPDASADGNEWIEKVLRLLHRVAELPYNWDGEGSPRPDPGIVSAVKGLLDRLQDSRLGAIPVAFVCPVGGGGIQLEWSSSGKHLEIEFMDVSTIVFLKEELTPQGESMASGEYPLANVESTRQLLDWFAAV